MWHSGVVGHRSEHYDLFRAQGYHVGSGAAEGACKQVIGQRRKQPGMIWTRRGSSRTLALRLAWLNSEWPRLCAEGAGSDPVSSLDYRPDGVGEWRHGREALASAQAS